MLFSMISLTHLRALLIFAALLSSVAATRAASDREVVRGFNLTVFGAEYSPMGLQSNYVRKFSGPVRFHIQNLATRDRTADVRAFILSLNRSINGLRAEIAPSASKANFIVYLVDRKDYVATVRDKIYRRQTASTPGKCLVRSVFSRSGISRSEAVIVTDEGEALFKRCRAEEILQGLGPLERASKPDRKHVQRPDAAHFVHAVRPADPQHAL